MLKAAVLTIFGANGDLTYRKLIPALFHLYQRGELEDNFRILGVSRTEFNDDSFRDTLTQKVNLDAEVKKDSIWMSFLQKVSYLPLDVQNSEDYQKLSKSLQELSSAISSKSFLYYLATTPKLFSPIVQNLHNSGLISPNEDDWRSDLIVEKPIGHDLDSATDIVKLFRSFLTERQIYRIDHYLGKEAIQNILMLRFANIVFESIWNRNYIDHIQVAVAESLGVETRASFYDKTGAVRDMLQNHMLQIVSLLCLEPPASLADSNSIRDEKVKVLKAVKRMDAEYVRNNFIRAQYQQGKINGIPVPGFKQEDGVCPDSNTETFVAGRIEIDNWRWAGVPIFLRTGKRLHQRISEVTVFFKKAPDSVIHSLGIQGMKPNVLAIQIQPNESISMQFNIKEPGFNMSFKPVRMNFSYNDSFAQKNFDAYERLLLDAFKGDQTLFIRDDEVLESWELITPLLKCWGDKNFAPMYSYEAGTWGPKEANSIIEPFERIWRTFD
jgi:glucose-6-phosphate 1-dehydrogenase